MISHYEQTFTVLNHFRPRIGAVLNKGSNGRVHVLADDPERVVKIVDLELPLVRFTNEVAVARHMGNLGIGPCVFDDVEIPVRGDRGQRELMRGFTMQRLERRLAEDEVYSRRAQICALLRRLADSGYEQIDMHEGQFMVHKNRIYMVDFDQVVDCDDGAAAYERMTEWL